MPRRIRVWMLAVLTALLLTPTLLGGTTVSGHADTDAPFGGLQLESSGGPCEGLYRVVRTTLCTHGPDPVPPEIADRGGPDPIPASSDADRADPAIGCDGDGSSGSRIQGIYARTSSHADRYSLYLPSLRTWAADVDAMFSGSAAETGGSRRARWVTDAGCELDVRSVVLSSSAETNFSAMVSELRAMGFSRLDRKYLIWFDSSTSGICGLGSLYLDDSAGPDNANNTNGGYARVDFGCWDYAEAHEIMHNLGGVQNSAPNSTYHQGTFGHCSDEYDNMCYRDGPGVTMTIVCSDTAHEQLFDCGHDDYFHTSPAPGSYLATHWNTASSSWLVGTPLAPTAPTDLSADGISASQIRLRWTDAAGESAYRVSRLEESTWVVAGTPAAGATSFTDGSLPADAGYWYELCATNDVGDACAEPVWGQVLESPPATSDDFADAHLAQPLPFAAYVDTASASMEPGERQPATDCQTIGATVWFEFGPSTSARYKAVTSGSDFDTVIGVWRGTSLADLKRVACNNDRPTDLLSKVVFDATGGRTYFLQAGGYLGATGDLVFRLKRK